MIRYALFGSIIAVVMLLAPKMTNDTTLEIIDLKSPYIAPIVKPIVKPIVRVDKTARVTCYIDKGIMANGEYVYPGAVAFSDRNEPLNQDIYIEGFGIMRITDRTALWVHEKYDVPTIDIWMSAEDCRAFGMKYLKYEIL